MDQTNISKLEEINRLISIAKESVARYEGKSVLEMKQRILVELEDLRYFISKIVKEKVDIKNN